MVSTLAGSGASGSADGTSKSPSFSGLYHFLLTADEYISMPNKTMSQKYYISGVVTTFAGNGTRKTVDGPDLSAGFDQPIGIVLDHADNFYITDEDSDTRRKITSDGSVVTVGGNGNHTTTDGVGGFASFDYPLGITIDTNGNIYEVDNGTGTIRKIVVQ